MINATTLTTQKKHNQTTLNKTKLVLAEILCNRGNPILTRRCDLEVSNQ